MASEFTENFNVQCLNGNYKYQFVKGNAVYSQTAQGAVSGLNTVTTSAVAVPLASVTAMGKAMFHNCDTTNYVQLGITVSATFYPIMNIQPDEWIWVRLDPALISGNVLQWKAHTASCEVEYIIFQN